MAEGDNTKCYIAIGVLAVIAVVVSIIGVVVGVNNDEDSVNVIQEADALLNFYTACEGIKNLALDQEANLEEGFLVPGADVPLFNLYTCIGDLALFCEFNVVKLILFGETCPLLDPAFSCQCDENEIMAVTDDFIGNRTDEFGCGVDLAAAKCVPLADVIPAEVLDVEAIAADVVIKDSDNLDTFFDFNDRCIADAEENFATCINTQFEFICDLGVSSLFLDCEKFGNNVPCQGTPGELLPYDYYSAEFGNCFLNFSDYSDYDDVAK